MNSGAIIALAPNLQPLVDLLKIVHPAIDATQVRAVLGTLEREVAEMEEVRQRLPREFDALMA